MLTVKEIKDAIASLSERDYAKLRDWLAERDEESWDREIEEDFKAGRLDHLVKEALSEESEGKTQDLYEAFTTTVSF